VKRAYFYFLIFATVLFSAGVSRGQNLSTEGDDFWIGFMDNWLQDPANPIVLEIYISADDSTRAHIDMPLLLNFIPVDTLVLPDKTVRITIPTHLGMSTGSNLVQNRGIHLTTDKDVSVYGINKRQYSADMAVILPAYALGNDYIVVSHWEDGNRNNNDNSDSEFLILAIEDNTRIEILPSYHTEGGNPPNVPFSVTLNRGQTYQIQARGDLTGTIIQSVANSDSECKKFAVFAGNQYTKVGECDHPNGHDHLYAQMYPVYTWGKEYITVAFNTRFNGDHVKVIAAEDETEIRLNGQPAGYLQRGDFLFLRELEGVNYISSENPISVAQFSRSQACDGTRGDPFIILINPNEQVLKKITFYAPSVATIQNYNLSIVTKTTDVPSVRLDATDISARFSVVPSFPDYSYAKVSVSAGNHTLKSSDGLIAYVYGYGNNESFGYPTGAGLTNLNLNFLVLDEQGVPIPFDQVCHGSEVWFKPDTDFDFTEFQWDFGDGEMAITHHPDSVSHVYEKPGRYIVELRGTTGSFGCVSGAEQSSIRVIQVINPRTHLLGPRSVCPHIQEVPYYVKEAETYVNQWIVEGGTISRPNNDTILVNWGNSNNNALIKVLSVDERGCIGDTVEKNIKIKIQLDPEAPMGPDSLCADDINNIPYEAFFMPGTTYQWMSDYGNVQSGQGSYSITMDWESFGKGYLWYTLESVTDTVCSGISDSLLVYIQRKPSDAAAILSDKTIYGINEPVHLELQTDSLYHIASWILEDQHSLDSVGISYHPVLRYNCPGDYLIEAVAMDTAGICDAIAIASHAISVQGPDVGIIQVSHEYDIPNQLFIKWNYSENLEYQKPYLLYRDYTIADTLIRNQTVYQDTSVVTDNQSYGYFISTNEDCETNITSGIHRSIWLNLPVNRTTEEEAMLEWNEYEGWDQGVEKYELWMRVDDGPFTLLNDNASSGFIFKSRDLGFEHCFKIYADELNGNDAYAWSNISCVTFVPELYPYNVITPNGDGMNDVFVIENIEHYPNAELTVFNRWGRLVYQTTGYQNNWGGKVNGNILSNGTYFYVLELNEPRGSRHSLNGILSILR